MGPTEKRTFLFRNIFHELAYFLKKSPKQSFKRIKIIFLSVAFHYSLSIHSSAIVFENLQLEFFQGFIPVE